MSGEISGDGVCKTRRVLSDVTNRPGKRAISTVLGNSITKSGDVYVKNVDNEEGDSQFAKQVCLGVEKLVKEKCRSEAVENLCEKGSSFNGKQSCGPPLGENIAPITSNIPSKASESSDLLDARTHHAGGDAALHSVVEVGDVSKDSCTSSISVPTCLEQCDGDCQEDEGGTKSGVLESDLVCEVSATNICHSDGKDNGTVKLASAKCNPIGCSRLAKPAGSNFFELERCTALKGEGSSNLSASFDLVRACSCSFCLKAAYIWSDLHYQDIKGRIAAIKKSQKEASNLAQRSCKVKESNTHDHGNSNKSSKLEYDLMSQWKSLFLNMEDIFLCESSQLEDSYLTLKDLREDCKTNLEMINGMPSEKQ